MDYEILFLKALLLTITIETIVLISLFKLFYKTKAIKLWLLILTGIVTSFATLPYLWFIIPVFIKNRMNYMIISEVAAVVIESFIILGLLRICYKKAILVSTICNMSSFLVGLIIKWP